MNDDTRSLFEPRLNTALIERENERDNILKTLILLVMKVRKYWYQVRFVSLLFLKLNYEQK